MRLRPQQAAAPAAAATSSRRNHRPPLGIRRHPPPPPPQPLPLCTRIQRWPPFTVRSARCRLVPLHLVRPLSVHTATIWPPRTMRLWPLRLRRVRCHRRPSIRQRRRRQRRGFIRGTRAAIRFERARARLIFRHPEPHHNTCRSQKYPLIQNYYLALSLSSLSTHTRPQTHPRYPHNTNLDLAPFATERHMCTCT